MTVKQKVINYVAKYPDATSKKVAKDTGTTDIYVRKVKSGHRAGKIKESIYIPDETPLTEKLRGVFKKGNSMSLDELSNYFDCGIGRIRQAVEDLTKGGFNFKINHGHVILSETIDKSESTRLDIKKHSTGFYRFGVLGDNHLCSKYSREDVLNALYDIYEKEGIKTVYNTGNWIDGEARFNKSDIHVYGLDNQVNYFIEKYPKKKGIKTYFIAGDDHEGWYTQNMQIDVGKYAEIKANEAGRDDLIYLGYMEADVILKAPYGETIIRVLHPGGGSSYAISYTIQKIVESYQGGEKPHILLAGHYHKADYVYCRGVHCVQTGTTQDQSPFMRKKKLAAHLGGWIIEVATDDNGAVTRFKQEFIPFYDNKYYKKWEYKK